MKKMKKTSFMLTTMFLAASMLFTGCSSSKDTNANSTQKENNSTSASSNASDQKKVVIKFGHGAAENNARHKASLKFKELVEQKSNGQIEIQVYPSEQLGSEPAMLQSVQGNMIQMTAVGTGIYAKYYKNIGVVELPYLFDNFEQAWKVLDGEFGKSLAKPLDEQGIHILSYWENGFRNVTNNVRPIENPSDLNGLKIRTPEIPVSISIFKTFGANPTPMAFGELYQALDQRIVDGQENPLTNIYNSKFYEVQKYVSMTGHQYSPLPLSISEKFWKTLTPEQQKLIEDSAKEAGQLHRDLVKQDDENLKAELKKNGMEVNEPEKAPFKEAAKPVYKEFEEVYGKELIDNLFKAIDQSK